MYVYMGHLTWDQLEPYEQSFWKKNKIDLLRAEVTSIQQNEKTIVLSSGERLAMILVLATGSTPNRFEWKGQEQKVFKAYTKQDLEQLEENQIKRAVIVGGGLIELNWLKCFIPAELGPSP